MSADNYLWVRRWRGAYYVEMRFASVDYKGERARPNGPSFPTLQEAINHALLHSGDCEYGMDLAPRLKAGLNAVRQES